MAVWLTVPLCVSSQVMVDFGKETERALKEVGAEELRQYAKAGQFPAGSMGPKVEAVLAFLDGNPGSEVRPYLSVYARMHAC